MNTLIFNTKDLLDAVKIGGDYASNNKVLPILASIKVIVKGDRCNIVSYDEKNAISYKCPIQSFDGDVTFCIGKKDLESYLSTLSVLDVRLEVDNEKMQCKVITNKGHVVLPLEDANCYPELVTEKESKSFKMDASVLQYWLSKASNFMEMDEFRLYKQSLHLISHEDKLHAFASEGHRMFHDVCENPSSESLELSIDRSAFSGLSKALKGEEMVTVRDGQSNITFITSQSVILVRKREFKAPDFFIVLTKTPLFEAKVNRKELLESLVRTMGISDDNKRIGVTLRFYENEMNIKASTWDNSKCVEETLPIDNGNELTVGFHCSLLYTCVNNFISEYIYLCPTGFNSLATIKGDLEDEECTLAMPIAV